MPAKFGWKKVFNIIDVNTDLIIKFMSIISFNKIKEIEVIPTPEEQAEIHTVKVIKYRQ